MKHLVLSVGLSVLALSAQAETALPQAHVNSMACLETMGQGTSWGQCLGLIFEPCVGFGLLQRRIWPACKANAKVGPPLCGFCKRM